MMQNKIQFTEKFLMTKNNKQKLIIFQNHQQNFLIGAPKFFFARAPKFLNPALNAIIFGLAQSDHIKWLLCYFVFDFSIKWKNRTDIFF